MNTNEPAKRSVGSSSLILRDHLAIQRTHLANERTLLAYLRSGVALFIAGVTIIHFASQGWFTLVGVLCIPAGAVTCWVGAARFRMVRDSLRKRVRRKD